MDKLNTDEERDYYGKSLLLAPDGTPMTTLANKRRDWYLRNNLAVIEPAEAPYKEYIRLVFEPKGGKENPDVYRQILETRCIVCGVKENLSIHHVIPRIIRRQLDDYEKNHNHWWCVLMCHNHHKAIEDSNKTLWSNEWQAFYRNDPFIKMKIGMITLKNIVENNALEQIPEEKIQSLLKESKHWKTVDDIILRPKFYRRLHKMERNHLNTMQSLWVKLFIQRYSIDGVKLLFRNSILEMKPKYLPDGFLQNTKVL